MLTTLFFSLFVLSFADLKPISKDNMDFSHWDTVLKKLVNTTDKIDGISLSSFKYNGLVDNYDFQNFTYQVENADTTGFDFVQVCDCTDFVPTLQFRAFWINVYNYLAVRLVLNHSTLFVDFLGL